MSSCHPGPARAARQTNERAALLGKAGCQPCQHCQLATLPTQSADLPPFPRGIRCRCLGLCMRTFVVNAACYSHACLPSETLPPAGTSTVPSLYCRVLHTPWQEACTCLPTPSPCASCFVKGASRGLVRPPMQDAAPRAGAPGLHPSWHLPRPASTRDFVALPPSSPLAVEWTTVQPRALRKFRHINDLRARRHGSVSSKHQHQHCESQRF